MAYVAPSSKADGDMVTSAIWNQDVVDNVKATLVGIVTSAGDLGYGTGAGAISRLPIGSASNVLKTNSGATAPEWGTVASSELTGWGNDKTLFTNSAGALSEASIGASGTVYKSAGATSDPTWSTLATTELSTSANKVYYGSNASAVTELSLGAANTVLKSGGATSAPSFGNVSATDINGGTWKTFHTDGSGDVQEIALGGAGEVLTAQGVSAAPQWAAAGGGGAWSVVGSSTTENNLTGGVKATVTAITGLSITKPFYIFCRWRDVNITGSSKYVSWSYTTSAGTTMAEGSNGSMMGFIYTGGGVTTGVGYCFAFPNFDANYAVTGSDFWAQRVAGPGSNVVGPINSDYSGTGASLGTTTPITGINIVAQPNSGGTVYVKDVYVVELQ
tara:strand:- start:1781 stop:2947 length:1167 start_codon:yes stop_codon:yes gene_type:complete